MKTFLKDIIRTMAAALVLFLVVTAGYAAIPLFTGPSGSNLINFPAVLYDLNAAIQAINAAIGNFLNFNTAGEPGELAINSTTAWAANGSVATSVTSVGPVGASTTVRRWLQIVDPSSGNIYYLPAF